MNRAHIIREIQRTAKENNGKPLGRDRFESETGIRYTDWFGVHWVRWSDAIREAGFAPNKFQISYDRADLLDRYAKLVQELGHLPVKGELRLKARTDKTFPADTTFDRLGTKAELIKQLLAHCQERTGYADVMKLCEAFSSTTRSGEDNDTVTEPLLDLGFVYLVKSGRYFKIGHSNAHGRRTYELDLQLPERTKTVHVIRTDDPPGIEAYWHTRFASKRKNGEWFELGAAEVAAFKRRKVM